MRDRRMAGAEIFAALLAGTLAACGGGSGGQADGDAGHGGGGQTGGAGGSAGAGGAGAGGAGAGGGGGNAGGPAAICDPPATLADTSNPDRKIGTGTAPSCTEAALREAVAAGGVLTFDCGPTPVRIELGSSLAVTKNTTIDGGGLVTLSGGRKVRILTMDTGNFEATSPKLVVQRLTLREGKASGTAIPLGTDVDGGGGAIFFRGGSVAVVNAVFEDNEAATLGPDVAGGAVFGMGAGGLTVVGSRFAGNRAANGGAIGVLGASLSVTNCVLDGNAAVGHGANAIDPKSGKQVGQGGNGGAISMDGKGRTLDVCGTRIAGNTGNAFGGAVFRTSYESEPTRIDRSTIDGNQITDSMDEESRGAGGLYLQGTSVTITASTISRNRAKSFAGVWIMAHGAAAGVADLTNVTIAGNETHARPDFTKRGIGAGLVIGDGTTGTIASCTIADNVAQFASGIARVSPLVVRNSIVANRADNEWTPLNCTGSMYASPPATGSGNLQWPVGKKDDMDCTAGITRADPKLGPLADNGGPTPTMLPADGSPARGTATADCPPTDQRGRARKTPCAAGAVEP